MFCISYFIQICILYIFLFHPLHFLLAYINMSSQHPTHHTIMIWLRVALLKSYGIIWKFFPNGRPPPPIGNRNKSKWQSDDETSRLCYIPPLYFVCCNCVFCILCSCVQRFTFCILYSCVQRCTFCMAHVRSFLSDFTLLLATLPRGKGPNHTLLPSVMRCCIFAFSQTVNINLNI